MAYKLKEMNVNRNSFVSNDWNEMVWYNYGLGSHCVSKLSKLCNTGTLWCQSHTSKKNVVSVFV